MRILLFEKRERRRPTGVLDRAQGGEQTTEEWWCVRERHEHSEMICLWRDGALCWIVSQEEEAAGWYGSDNRGGGVHYLV